MKNTKILDLLSTLAVDNEATKQTIQELFQTQIKNVRASLYPSKVLKKINSDAVCVHDSKVFACSKGVIVYITSKSNNEIANLLSLADGWYDYQGQALEDGTARLATITRFTENATILEDDLPLNFDLMYYKQHGLIALVNDELGICVDLELLQKCGYDVLKPENYRVRLLEYKGAKVFSFLNNGVMAYILPLLVSEDVEGIKMFEVLVN